MIVLFAVSGLLALGALAQFVASWRGEPEKASASGAVVLLGSRMCLVCWSYGLLLKTTGWAVGGFERLPGPLQTVLAIPFYPAMAVAAAGIVMATIGAAGWLIRD